MGQKNAVTKRFCGDKIRFADLVDDIKSRNVAAGNFETQNEFLCKVKKTDRLWPVYTVCLYLGEEPWDGPRSLRDMMNFGEDTDGFSKCFADYTFRLYCVNEEQDFSVFHTDVRSVFELLPLRKDKKRLLEKLKSNKEYTHMTEDSLEFLSVVMDSPGIWKNRKKYMNKDTNENKQKKVEGYDMCQAIKELIEDGRQEGRLEGRLEGKMEGHFEALKLSVENLMKSLSISLEKACELLDITEERDRLKQMMD